MEHASSGEQRIEMWVESRIDLPQPYLIHLGKEWETDPGQLILQKAKAPECICAQPTLFDNKQGREQEGKEKTTLREKLLLLLEPNPEAGAQQSELVSLVIVQKLMESY